MLSRRCTGDRRSSTGTSGRIRSVSNKTRQTGSSWALQGCLFGAVALFVLLLLLMVFLAYQRFRENTEVGTVPAPAISLVASLSSSAPVHA